MKTENPIRIQLDKDHSISPDQEQKKTQEGDFKRTVFTHFRCQRSSDWKNKTETERSNEEQREENRRVLRREREECDKRGEDLKIRVLALLIVSRDEMKRRSWLFISRDSLVTSQMCEFSGRATNGVCECEKSNLWTDKTITKKG